MDTKSKFMLDVVYLPLWFLNWMMVFTGLTIILLMIGVAPPFVFTAVFISVLLLGYAALFLFGGLISWLFYLIAGSELCNPATNEYERGQIEYLIKEWSPVVLVKKLAYIAR